MNFYKKLNPLLDTYYKLIYGNITFNGCDYIYEITLKKFDGYYIISFIPCDDGRIASYIKLIHKELVKKLNQELNELFHG